MVELYDYQVKPFEIIKRSLKHQDKVLIVMATSLGKSVIAGHCAIDLLSLGRGLVLCHENYILEQNMKVFRQVLGNETSLGLFNGDKKTFKDVDVLFASFQTMREWKEVFLEDEFAWIIVDEGHHAPANTFESVLEYFSPKKMIGMTATPKRGDDKDIRDIFGDPVVNISLVEAIVNGWVTPVEYHVMNDNIDTKKVRELIKSELNERRHVSVKQLNSTIFIKHRDEKIAEKIKSFGDLKTIIFCSSILAVESIKEFFPDAQVKHSKQSKGLNKKAYNDFKSGKCKVLIVVDQLNEGIDVPDVELIVFLRNTDSERIFLQQLGRGLRRVDGKNKVIVLDFVANLERIMYLNEMREEVKGYIEHDAYDFSLFHLEGKNFSFEFAEDVIEILEHLKHMKTYTDYNMDENGVAFMPV